MLQFVVTFILIIKPCYQSRTNSNVVNTETVYTPALRDVVLNCSMSIHHELNINNASMSWDRVLNGSIKYIQLFDGIQFNLDLPKNKYKLVGNISDRAYSLLIINITHQDEASYRCLEVLTNDSLIKTTKYKLLLTELPSNLTIHNYINGTINGMEGIPLDLICTVISGIPKETLHWFEENVELVNGSSSQVVYKTVPQPIDNGRNLTCTVHHDYIDNPLLKTVMLNIKYKPQVEIENMDVIFENETISLRCLSDANPQTTATFWSHEGNTIQMCNSSSCEYTFKSLRQHSGIYKCVARNELGEGVSETEVVVYYPPSVTLSNINSTLECQPEGLPTNYSYLSWQHYTESGNLIRTLNGSKYVNVLESHTKPYKLSGIYECTVSNGIPDYRGSEKQTGNILVKLSDVPEIMSNSSNTQYGKFGFDVQIDVHVYSYPEIKVIHIDRNGTRQWQPNIIVTNGTLVKEQLFGKSTWISCSTVSLYIGKLDKDDFTIYRFEIRNAKGYRVFDVMLTSKDTPQSPQITAVRSSKLELIIYFNSGFNGGLPQSFTVQFKRDNEFSWTESDVINDNNSQSYQYRIKELSPGTLYYIKVYASNRVGKSLYSRVWQVRTLEDNHSKMSFHGVVAGSTIFVVVVVILTAVACKNEKLNCSKFTPGIGSLPQEHRIPHANISVENEMYQSDNSLNHVDNDQENNPHYQQPDHFQFNDFVVENQLYQTHEGLIPDERQTGNSAIAQDNERTTNYNNYGQTHSQHAIYSNESNVDNEYSTSDDDDDDFMSLDGIVDYRKSAQRVV